MPRERHLSPRSSRRPDGAWQAQVRRGVLGDASVDGELPGGLRSRRPGHGRRREREPLLRAARGAPAAARLRVPLPTKSCQQLPAP